MLFCLKTEEEWSSETSFVFKNQTAGEVPPPPQKEDCVSQLFIIVRALRSWIKQVSTPLRHPSGRTRENRLVELAELTLNPLTSAIVAPSSNAGKWQMGFNSAFKGLNFTSSLRCTADWVYLWFESLFNIIPIAFTRAVHAAISWNAPHL